MGSVSKAAGGERGWKRAKGASTSMSGRAAFPIDHSIPIGSEGEPPISAEQYLLQVRRQAYRLPNVVSAAVPESSTRAVPTRRIVRVSVPASPDHRLPRPDWSARFTMRFAELRQSWVRVQHDRDETLVSSRGPLPHANNASSWRHRFSNEELLPTLRELAIIDQVTTRRLLQYLSSMLEPQSEDPNANPTTRTVFIWLWSLLLHLDKPLLPDTSATLRSLYRSIATRRANLDEDDARCIAMFNMILAVIAETFGQSIPMEADA